MVDLVSIIIRTRNDGHYLKPCLVGVSCQQYVDFEVIVVDNDSTDDSRKIARDFDCKVVSVSDDEWSFGKALNRGIEQSSGRFCALLSGHCIPANASWLMHLKYHFNDDQVMGVYGRQLPLQETPDQDKRDLWNQFGLEKRVQKRDPFFHNANSMIRKSVWQRTPFSEESDGLEDRIWAKTVLDGKTKIVYCPDAAVFHYHGLNHGGDVKRAARIVRMIEKYGLYKV